MEVDAFYVTNEVAVLPAMCLLPAVKRGYLNKNTVELTVYNLGALQRRTIRIFGGPILKAHPEEDDCVEGQMSFDDLL